MSANVEPKVLLAGPALAADRSLRRRLSGDYILQTADTIGRATAAMDRGDIDLVVCEQQFEDGRGVDFLQGMRTHQPNALRILVLATARREEIAKAINDAAIYQVLTSPWEPEQISLMVKRALGKPRAGPDSSLPQPRAQVRRCGVLHRQNETMTRTLRGDLRVRQARVPQQCDGRGLQPGKEGGCHRFTRVDSRRDRYGQGASRTRAAPLQWPSEGLVPRSKLRGAVGQPAAIGVVRTQTGRVHRRRERPAGIVSGGRRRHCLPG